MNMLIFTPFALSLYWMLTLDIMFIPVSGVAYVLNLAENSVDDMYHGCEDRMKEILYKKYPEEVKWKTFEACAETKLKEMSKEGMYLTKEHLQAICMYTDNSVYAEFNTETREKGNEYGKSYQFHNLHFHLTSAIQTLNSKHTCHTTYRRNSVEFTGEVKQKIRFGSFASSSFRTDLRKFGSKTCFQIKTCLGAPLEKFSLKKDEEEVLIPPYETFVIKEVHKKPVTEGLKDCEVLFVLENEGLRSTLNCNFSEEYLNPPISRRNSAIF